MTSRPSAILVPGILSRPSNLFGWTDRTARLLELRHNIQCERMEYFLGFVRSPLRLKSLSNRLAEVVGAYNVLGVKPNIIAHSNGNVLACRALEKFTIEVSTLHMLMPASWDSLVHCGLDQALRDGRLEEIRFYGSRNDFWVRWGGNLTGFLRPFGLGYGSASYTGLTDIPEDVKDRVHQIDLTPWGHCTFSTPDNLPNFLSDYVVPHLR